MKELHVSRTVFDMLREQVRPSSLLAQGTEVIENPCLPFEITYNACELATRDEVEIPSGEWCHAMVIPNNFNSQSPIQLYASSFEDLKDRFVNFWLHTLKKL